MVRQWLILRALENSRGRGASVKDLHEALDRQCSLRTIYRDLENLQEVHFPIAEDGGLYRILRGGEGGWYIPLDPSELLALLLTEELLEPARGTFLFEPLAALRRRLSAVLTPEGRSYVAELKSRAVASVSNVTDTSTRRAQMRAVEEAIHNQRRLRLLYAKPNAPAASRVVDPYCVWYVSGRTYLIARCHKARDLRTFAVQRIEDAEVLDEGFEASSGFDPASFVRHGFGVFHGDEFDFVIEFRPDVAYLIRERRFHHTQQIEELDDGGVRLTMTCAGLPEIASWIAGFGGKARPLEPESLILAVRDLHREGLRALAQHPDAGELT